MTTISNANSLSLHDALPIFTVRQIVQDDDLYQDAGLITLLQSNDPPDIYFQWGGALVARDAAAGYSADLSEALDRKSTRLNSSHVKISYAVFCLKKKKQCYT